MLRLIENIPLKEGSNFCLTEAWHEKLVKALRVKTYPYEFILKSKYRISNKVVGYIFEAKQKKNSKKVIKLAISTYVLKYYFGTDQEDSNMGLNFKEYLPFDETDILISNIRDISVVQPALFHSVVSEIVVDEVRMPFLDFALKYKIGNASTSLKYYTDVVRATWKFLYNEDTTYMNDYEKTFHDTFIHKRYVEQSCKKLARYLEENGATNHARDLMRRSKVHDDSKITCEDELRALSMIINDKSNMKDAQVILSPLKQDSIKLHHKHNSHHPEHYNSCMDMTRLDIMEMVCDWHARSIQYKTDFLDYVIKAQNNRFHFPEWMFAEIYHYCEVLNK